MLCKVHQPHNLALSSSNITANIFSNINILSLLQYSIYDCPLYSYLYIWHNSVTSPLSYQLLKFLIIFNLEKNEIIWESVNHEYKMFVLKCIITVPITYLADTVSINIWEHYFSNEYVKLVKKSHDHNHIYI